MPVLAWEAVVALLADSPQLDGWARNLSPLRLSGQVHVDAPNGGALILLAIASAASFTFLIVPSPTGHQVNVCTSS